MGLREINEKRTREMVELEARRIFCAKGIGETDLKEVAQAVGIPRTTLYTYYRDKQELAAAVYLRNLRSLLWHLEKPALEKRWRACGEDLLGFLRDSLDTTLRDFMQDPDTYLYDFIYNLQASKSHLDPTTLEGHAADAAEGLQWLAERVEEGIRLGQLPGCRSYQDYQDCVIFPFLSHLVRLATFERQKARPDFKAAAEKARAFRDLLLRGACSAG
nr:helix-turn-helix domain-containing protein [uncultured Holophaga sp.]